MMTESAEQQSETSAPVASRIQNLKKRLNNPYWFELLSILVLAGIGIFLDVSFLPQIVVAVLTTVLLDLAINYFRGRVHLSKSAAITGLLIGSILQPAGLEVFVFAGVVAIVSKHVIRLKGGNIFNPAALGIILSIYLFSVADIWWSSAQIIPVIILGLLVAGKIGKLRLALSFLIVFFILGFIQLLPIQGFSLANASLSFFNLPLFMAFFMVTEPKTTPFQKQLVFGPLFAIVVFAFLFAGVPSFLLVGLLAGNLIAALYRKWK